ncbi:unnamed protein product [Haemonchus placei]|uniref:C2H2-type domain-containing protein n=1 Tax=Haemonchus placei TaxID=6290 RepID=A0A0N4W9R3_HAEPC|nr:unnamed protein product [Haemonchus placei]
MPIASDIKICLNIADMSSGNEERFGCPLCGKLMLRKNVYDHLRKIHYSSEQQVESMKANIKIEANAKKDEFHIICPVCDDQFLDQEELAIHCNVEHTHDGANGEEQDYTVHDLDFASKKDFEMWLNETCEKTVTSLYKNSKSANTIYYRCNRSGKFVSKSKQRVRCSRKAVLHCSCYVNARFNSDGTVGVKACFGHVGHELEPALLHLSDSQRQYLKSMLEEHSLDYVIRRCRKDFPAKDSRMHFMTKADLWNIINKYDLKPGYRDADDLKSIHLREAEHNEDDGRV